MFDEIEYEKPSGVYFNTVNARSSSQMLSNNDSSTHLVSMVQLRTCGSDLNTDSHLENSLIN
jgi:hypothetical protein